MVGASKILTVSYGTFSCTLEGFDEPFNTMKAIAEYFRDLAADDRYFGAEPPTPDAAMLHQIAEREMKRRVEARVQENGVVLRASDSSAATVAAPQPTDKAAPVANVAAPAKVAADTIFEDQPEEGPTAFSPSETAISDSVAAKLSRIRNAMAETRAAGETTRPPISLAVALKAAEAEEAQKARAKAEAAEKAEADARARAEAEAAEKAEADARARAEAAEKAEADARARAEAAEKAEATDEVGSPDAFLASLIGAFDDEDRAPTEHFEDDDLNVSSAAPQGLDADGDDTLMASLSKAMAEPSDDGKPELDTDATVSDPSQITNLDKVGLDFPDQEDNLQDLAALGTAGSDDQDDTSDAIALVAISFGVGFAKDVGTLDEGTEETAEETTKDAAEMVPQPEAEPTAKPDEAPESQTNATLQRARARVVKIRRTRVEEAKVAPPAGAEATSTTLSPEAEADLMRELAEVQGDAPAPQTKDVTAADEGQNDTLVRPQRPVSARRRAKNLTSNDDDDSVKRLLDQTNTEFQGTENRRRLSAISHLKAAVAATVADRKSGGDKGPTEEMRMNPYRNDLQRAVRPRNHGTDLAVSGDRPAPLVLVSEQRIDTPRVKPSTTQSHISPVRPRRVSGGNLAVADHDDDADFDAATDGSDARNIFGATTSFAEYAERLGADSLTDLLEAAAAYAAHIEGRNEVSRPQMVEHVLTVQPELNEDREAMLRSFGTLLRDGRIEKIRRGYFCLSEKSTIQDEARKAAED